VVRLFNCETNDCVIELVKMVAEADEVLHPSKGAGLANGAAPVFEQSECVLAQKKRTPVWGS
jgi:hypothetical protein